MNATDGGSAAAEDAGDDARGASLVPLALLALVLYPLVWLLLIPFRLIGIVVDGALGLVRGIVMLPARLLAGPRAF